MPPRRRPVSLLTVLTVLTVLIAAAASAPPAAAQTPPAAISVQGGHLLNNGFPWTPRGVQIVGLVAPDSALWGKYIAAHAQFGAPELQAAVADHADVVRFQVSEFGLDPQGPLYSPAYVEEVENGIQLARSVGLAVIVSLQAQAPAGEWNRCPMPDAGAERVWQELAPVFAGDTGVMYELYNEPAIAATAADWAIWRDGGPVTYSGGTCQAVGMQTLIDDIRSESAGNVIIVPGLAGEQTLAGMTPLTDPANPGDPQLAYGVHYPSLVRPSTAWDRAFGAASATLPVIVTEWNANSTTNCVANAPTVAQLLLDYLQSKQIGIVGFAFDLPGTIAADASYVPTSYQGFACGVAGGGPGELLFSQFAAEARAGDGAQPDAPPAWIIGAGTLKRLSQLAPGTTARFLDTPRTYVTGASGDALAALGAPTAVATESFADARRLVAAVNAGRLRPGTVAVLYDPGATRATPRSQQRHPTRYFKLAATAAHTHGLLFVADPALTLAAAIHPRLKPGRLPRAFLRLRIAAGAARFADAYEVQAQDSETTPGAYASFIRRAGAQAARARRGIELLAGISAGPRRSGQTPPALLDAYLASHGLVSGYALVADRAGGAGPDPALGFLRLLVRYEG